MSLSVSNSRFNALLTLAAIANASLPSDTISVPAPAAPRNNDGASPLVTALISPPSTTGPTAPAKKLGNNCPVAALTCAASLTSGLSPACLACSSVSRATLPAPISALAAPAAIAAGTAIPEAPTAAAPVAPNPSNDGKLAIDSAVTAPNPFHDGSLKWPNDSGIAPSPCLNPSNSIPSFAAWVSGLICAASSAAKAKFSSLFRSLHARRASGPNVATPSYRAASVVSLAAPMPLATSCK
jgi:hypothetical protein